MRRLILRILRPFRRTAAIEVLIVVGVLLFLATAALGLNYWLSDAAPAASSPTDISGIDASPSGRSLTDIGRIRGRGRHRPGFCLGFPDCSRRYFRLPQAATVPGF